MPSNTEAFWTTHGSGGWTGTYSYRYHSTDSNGDYVCYLGNLNSGAAMGYSIKFNPATGVWSDNDNNNPPAYITSTSTFAASTSISGYPDKLWLWHPDQSFRLNVSTPTWAADTSSGGDTGIEEIVVDSNTTTQKKVHCNFW